MVEQEAVNFEVAGSSPVPGAMNKKDNPTGIIFLFISFSRTGREPALAGSTGRRSEKNLKSILDFSSEEERKDFA